MNLQHVELWNKQYMHELSTEKWFWGVNSYVLTFIVSHITYLQDWYRICLKETPFYVSFFSLIQFLSFNNNIKIAATTVLHKAKYIEADMLQHYKQNIRTYREIKLMYMPILANHSFVKVSMMSNKNCKTYLECFKYLLT